MKNCTMALSVGLAVTWASLGQPAALPAEFEVASVKPSSEGSGRMGIGLFTYPGGRIRASYVPLEYLITQAFGIQSFQISGGPGWMRADRFDLEAKPPATSKSAQSNPRNPKLPPNAEQRQMLQALLQDRFRLRFHWETKQEPVYYLVTLHRSPNLHPAKDAEEYPWAGAVAHGGPFADGIAGMNITMGQLAERLSAALGRPVIDRTGLTGAYDFRFLNPSADPDDLAATILSSVRGIGLRLEGGKGPTDVLVIEHAEKPAGN